MCCRRSKNSGILGGVTLSAQDDSVLNSIPSPARMASKPPAAFLLIDLGNTTVKLRLADPEILRGATRRLSTAALLAADGPAALKRSLAGWRYEHAILSSVVPAAARTVIAALPGIVQISPRHETGVDLRGYPGAKTLGADRLANLAGALALHGPPPLIVVDFGTAATFNVLDARGRFLGGTIAPGLASMTGYLPARAAQLPPIRLAGPVPAAIGRSTPAAMRAGSLLGYRGLVREILDRLRGELGDPAARVIATGGDAAFLAAKLGLPFDAVDPELTLHGLRAIAARRLRPADGGDRADG